MDNEQATVFVVDDDPSVLRGIERLLKSVGINVKAFGSAQEFLVDASAAGARCLILDVRMPGLSGLELQEKLNAAGLVMPIIFITGHGNVSTSVKAMKAGAADFLEKPFDEQTLLDAVHKALEKDRVKRAKEAEIHEIRKRAATLTPREQEVFSLVVTGMLNKQIAYELGASEKTIKVHRGRVMEKMEAQSLADLIRQAERIGMPLQRDNPD